MSDNKEDLLVSTVEGLKKSLTEEHKRKIGIGISNFWKGKERIPWNKGLTKETDERVRRYAGKLIGHKAYGGFETRYEKGNIRSEESITKQTEAIMGENNPNWRGGISNEPYGFDFTVELKAAVRERDNYSCVLCGRKEKDRTFSAHHVDYDKTNNDESNLVTLCSNCHARTNHKRKKWKKYFKELIR